MTQEEAAKKLGLGRSVLAHIETGERELGALDVYKMCKVYDVDPAFFFRDRDG